MYDKYTEAMMQAKQAGLEANKRYFGDDVPKGGAIAFLDGLDAFLAALKGAGWVIVPKEASEAMLEAAVSALDRHTSETEYSTPLAVWSAMIAAASQGEGT